MMDEPKSDDGRRARFMIDVHEKKYVVRRRLHFNNVQTNNPSWETLDVFKTEAEAKLYIQHAQRFPIYF